MSDSNCIICFEALSSQPLGVAVPCGHCFHQTCFAQWEEASSRRQTVSCPMCNGRTSTFCKLFLDLKEREDSDDDFSLSSIETNDTEDHKKQASNKGEDSADGAQSSGTEQVAQGIQEEQENNQDSNAESNPPDVIEIDDNSVVEILSNASPARGPKKREKTPSSQTSSDKDGNNASRIRRKAKRLRKQIKFLESQRAEFVERERKLLEEFGKSRERLEQLEDEHEAQQDTFKSAQRELEGLRVNVARLAREKQTAEAQRDALRGQAERAEADFEEMKSRCRQDVQNAQSKAMQEVKAMTERQPILIQENHDLKELMVKKDQQLRAMKQKLESLQDCVQERADKEMVKQRVSAKKQQKYAARALQEMQQEQARQDEERIHAQKQAQKAKASRPSKTYSAQASRVSVAGLKVVAKKKSVMDVLGGSVPRRKDGKRGTTKVSKDTSRTEDERASMHDDDEAVLGGMSLHVSGTKKRKIEPLPAGRAGTIKANKPVRKDTNMFDYFGRN